MFFALTEILPLAFTAVPIACRSGNELFVSEGSLGDASVDKCASGGYGVVFFYKIWSLGERWFVGLLG